LRSVSPLPLPDSKRIAAITTAAMSFAFCVRAASLARLRHSGEGAGVPPRRR
jgi:hypothetical protein